MTAADLDAVEAGCPVCGRAAGERSQCPGCDWTLRTPWRAGRLDHAARTDFQARLSAKRLEYDARIVARIAAEPGPYATCVRGGPPTVRQWAAARLAAAADGAGAADEETLRARLRALLAGLTPDSETTVTEVGQHGIAVLRLRLDQHGTPTAIQDGDIADWSMLIPRLPATGPERHFRLAAGAELARTDGQPGDPLALIPRPATGPGGQRMVICRPAGWAVLERTAGLLAARSGETPLRAAAGPDATPVLATLAELATAAPLTRAYQLLVADVDADSGAVRTRARQLFAPGDLPGAQAWLPLRRLPGDSATTALAIFADGGTSEPMALYSAPLPASAVFQLEVSLLGPGRVQINQPEAVTENGTFWRRVRASLPQRVDVTTAPADLVCAVDLTGPEELVQGRRQLVIGLLKQLIAEYPEPGRLRVGVLTCRDHEYGPNEKDDVISACGLRPAGEAADWLSAQPAEEPRYIGAAPIEDLLARAYEQLEQGRRQGRAARVLTVAGKPPHPARQDAYAPSDMQRVHPCPHRTDWRFSLARLVQAAARCVTVSDAVHVGQAAPAVWGQLGPHGLHALAAATPRRLGEDLGLLIRPDQRIPIPLPDWK
jgi:hypothetical protein